MFFWALRKLGHLGYRMSLIRALSLRSRGEVTPHQLSTAIALERSDTCSDPELFASAMPGSAYTTLSLSPNIAQVMLATDSLGSVHLYRTNVLGCEQSSPIASSVVSAHSALTSSAWYPDSGLFVLGGSDGKVSIWDALTFQQVHNVQPGRRIYCTALSSCASTHALVAVGCTDREVHLLDLTSGGATQVLSSPAGHATGPILSLCWHPTSEYQLVSAGSDGRVLFWDVRRSGAMSLLGALDMHNSIGSSGGVSGSIMPAPSISALNASVAHTSGANGLAFAPPFSSYSQSHRTHHTLITSGLDQKVRAWEVAPVFELKERPIDGTVSSFSQASTTMSRFAEDESDLFTGLKATRINARNTLRRFGPARGVVNRAVNRTVPIICARSGQDGQPGICFHPNSGPPSTASLGAPSLTGGALMEIGGSGVGSILMMNLATGALVRELKGHYSGSVLSLTFNASTGDLFSSGEDGFVLRWRSNKIFKKDDNNQV